MQRSDKESRVLRRAVQYTAGLICMALGVVLIRKANIGISPLSAIPAAVSNVTSLTLGNTSIIFHILCTVGQLILIRDIRLKAILTLPLAFGFGYLIDLLMFLLGPEPRLIPVRVILCFIGILASGLGIALIVGANLMLPAPDAFLREASVFFKRPLSQVKTIGDIIWVVITAIIELLTVGRLSCVGIGTVASMLLTGRTVGMFQKLFPCIDLSSAKRAGSEHIR